MLTFKSLFNNAATKVRYPARTDDGTPVKFTVSGALASPSLASVVQTIRDNMDEVKVKGEIMIGGRVIPINSTGKHVAESLLQELQPTAPKPRKGKKQPAPQAAPAPSV